MTRRIRSIFLLSLLLLAAAAIAGVARPREGRAADNPLTPVKTVTVSGSGSVSTVPDRASFDFTVDTQAATAQAALARNASAAAAMIAAIKNAGVADADLQTGQVALSPRLNDAGTDVLGYTASNTVTATIAITKAGALVDAAVGAGATGVSGPTLTRSDSDALYDKALQAAVANAADKAKTLATAAGLSLGSVQTMSEGSQQPVVFAAGKMDAGVATPIEAGTQTIDATVTVTYGLS
ncbi:MAG TPA: SIMPL domain-containing protein [Gaiellaceae bacterium]|jgi:hypothetical protein